MPSAIRSLRILRKHWKLALIAVFSLSLAMALGVITLSISNTFLLLPPAATEPDRLVTVYTRAETSDVELVSWPDVRFYRQNNHVFTDIAAAPNSISLSADQEPGQAALQLVSRPVSENYFSVMGIRPFLGRLFSKGDDDGDQGIAVMTWSCWNRLGADRKIVGKKLAGHTIVGVAPKEFTGSFYGLNGDLLVPMGQEYTAARNNPRDARRLYLTARLKPGVTRQQAQAEMKRLSAQLAAAYPKEDRNRTAVVSRATLLPTDGIDDVAIAAALLLGVVLLVLLIACANVANLLLAVAVGRRQEASIKLALGAQRGRLIREFLKESAVICIASGLIGYAIAWAAIARYSNYTFTLPIYGAFSPGLNLHIGGAVVLVTAALILIAILATGLAPALYASAPDLAQVLGGEIVVGGTRKNARRSALVIIQVAICTLVLIGMGLCQRSLYNLRRVDPGFSARNLLAVPVFPKSSGGYTEARGRELYDALRARSAALPGIESVGMASDLPLLGGKEEQVKAPDTGKKTQINHIIVDAGYFGTLGISVLAGRTFNSTDREASLPVVVVNRKMAGTFWPGRDPIGRVVTVADSGRKLTVIGMVADGRYDSLDEAPQPFMYYNLTQDYQDSMNIVARTKDDPRFLIEPLTKALRTLDAPFYFAPSTFSTWMNFTLLGERIIAGGATALSGLGLVLAIIGLFGAISYSVSERKKELGIRVALGARRSQLLKMIFRQTLKVTGIGIFFGILLGIVGTIVAQSQLYGIAAVEWSVLLSVALAMLGISLIVAYLSARTWVKVDPMEAVRHA